MKWSLQFDITCCHLNQNWKRVCNFLCQKTVIESYDRSRLFSFLFIQQFNWMLSTNTSAFDTSSTPTPVDSMSRIFMFLFLSACFFFLNCTQMDPSMSQRNLG